MYYGKRLELSQKAHDRLMHTSKDKNGFIDFVKHSYHSKIFVLQNSSRRIVPIEERKKLFKESKEYFDQKYKK